MMNNDLSLLNFTYLTELARAGYEARRQLDKLNRFLMERNCTYKGEPMPTLLKPVFISPRQEELLSRTVNIICSALNKFIQLYLRDKQVRKIMNFTSLEEELFSINPGYSIPLVIARLDAFMEGEDIKFLEFNCDSPAGIAYSDIMEEGFREFSRNYPFFQDWDITYFRRQELLLKAFRECYREFQSGHAGFPDIPTIAIVDWEGLSTSSEFELLKNFFKDNGLSTVITSPQKISVKKGRAQVDGREIHLIYRRVITRELLERTDEVEEYIRVIKEGYACVFNPFQSYIVGNKKVLSLLTDARFQNIYTEEEKAVIKKTIPWTRILTDTAATYRGGRIELYRFIPRNKDTLVLKPANSYGGKDVYLGRETDRATWNNLVKTHINSEEWIVQEYVPIPREFFPTIEDNTYISLKNVNINPFAFRGRYAGTISRISENSVINVSAGGGLVPTMSAKKRI